MEFQAPVAMGVSFINTRINGIYQLLSPAQNTNGVIIKTCYMALSAGHGGLLYADTAAPASYNDLTKRQLFGSNSATSTSTTYTQAYIMYPLYVYPGLGIWITTNADLPVAITYDVLDVGGLVQPPVIPAP
jgi:hypothetical protein